MYNESVYRSISRFSEEQGIQQISDLMVEECAFGIFVNGSYCDQIVCTPSNLNELVTGHLAITDRISVYDEITTLDIKDKYIFVNTELKPKSKAESKHPIDFACQGITLVKLMSDHLNSSELHRATGGVHIMSLAAGDQLLVSREDIGRHNAVDKVFGYCLINHVSCADKIFLSSGRITAEIIQKLKRMGIRMVVSRAAVTGMAMEMAAEAGITVIGFARGNRFNIYSHPERVIP